MSNKKPLLLFGVLWFISFNSVSGQQTNTSFSFTLNNNARTSAGIYKTDGTLIRTLWNGVDYSAGTHQINWDRKDDAGIPVADGIYTAKVLSNNIKYTWEGVIGNTSAALTGETVHRSYSPINGITIRGNYAYYTIEYPEGMASQAKFALANPQVKIPLNVPSNGSGQTSLFCCSDGTTVFYGGCDIYSTNVSAWFIFGSNVSNDNVKNFSAGEAFTTAWGTTYTKVIGKIIDKDGVITGMDVQKTGNYLFVSHRDLNQIRVYNKNTGALVQTISFTAPKILAIDGSDKLWVYSETNTIARYIVAGNGTISADGTVITGTTDPLAIAVTPDNKKVAIIDGGSSQQVKFYSNSTGAFVESLGQAGGYSTSPIVANDKFYFSDSRDAESRNSPVNEPIRFGASASMAFQSDGSFWITDRHNCRLQHFSNANVFIETIQTIPGSRSTRVDPNDNTRVFADYLEFKVDYSKPLSSANGSWTFIKNWRYNMTDEYDIAYFRLRGVTTLSNGRTYALQQSYVNQLWQVLELSSTGLRFTGITFSNGVNIRPDGSLRRLIARSTGASTKLYSKPLTGFDGSNNPVWGTEVELMSSPLATPGDPLYMGFVGWEEPNLDFTSTGIYIGYEGGVAAQSNSNFYSSKYHLGGIKDGNWVWKTAKNTPDNYTGNYPTNGDYDIWNNVIYPAGPVIITERSIFWGYHGENWKDAQANRWQHVYDNGLLLGTFGTDIHTVGSGIAPAEMAGNVLTAQVVKTGDDYYLYHCDESAHGGIHRWKISGLNTIQEQSIPLLPFAGLPPTANAGNDIIMTLPTNSVTVSGSGSDPDGTITSYVWSRVSGPATFTFANANAAATAISNLVQGTYVFRLTVTDNSGATATDDLTVTVNAAPNQLPTVNAGNDIIMTLPANSTILTGNGSDADGTIVSYGWSHVNGPATFTFGSAGAAATTLSNLVQGTYVFRLIVTDNSGATATDDVTVTVNAAPNQAPTANAGNNIALVLPVNSTSLTGSGSDVDGTIVSYAWSRLSGPTTFSFGSAGAATNTLSNLLQGIYVFRLTVTDNSGATATDDVTVTVNAAPNQAPTANAGNNIILILPANSATLTGSGTDPDGAIISYAWSRVSGPTTFSFGSADAATNTLSNLLQGIYVFRLTVTDNSGATATDDVTVTVNAAPNQAPTANAGNNIILILPANSATLTGSGTDPDGAIISYAWSRVSGPTTFSFGSADAATNTLSNLVQGIYVFRLTVTDNSGATAIDDVTVTVNAAPNQAPAANAGNDIVLTLPVNSSTLTGSGSDPDGTIVSYAWSKISGPATFTFGSAGASITALTNLVQGTYVFRLTVTDNNGASATDDVTVTVNAAPNQAPTARTENDIVLTLPTTSTQLHGNTSSDPDGVIVSYEWTQTSVPGQAVITNGFAAIATVSDLSTGIYTFQLKVTDDDGASSTKTIGVTVKNQHGQGAYFNIYPNPTPGVLSMQYVENVNGKFRITIYDANRRLMRDEVIDKNQVSIIRIIDVSLFESGVYFIQIMSPDNQAVVKQFVKM